MARESGGVQRLQRRRSRTRPSLSTSDSFLLRWWSVLPGKLFQSSLKLSLKRPSQNKANKDFIPPLLLFESDSILPHIQTPTLLT